MTFESLLSSHFKESFLRPITQEEVEHLSKIDLFALVFSNRSGSTLLADALYRRGLPIPPQVEILDPELVVHVTQIENKPTFTDYFLDTVFGWTDRGVCGFKFGVEQLRWLEEIGLLPMFRSRRLLHISRNDKVAQAVSLFIARCTGQWHLGMQARQQSDPVMYSAEGIREALQTILAMEADITKYAASQQIPVHEVTYEALINDMQGELQVCCEFLQWHDQRFRDYDDEVPPLASQHTSLNDSFAERFRREL